MRRKGLRLAALFVAGASLLAGCAAGPGSVEEAPDVAATGAPAPEAGKVRIGIAAPAATLLVPYFALDQGLFAEEGLDDVEVSFIPGPQLVPAAAGGQVEIAIASAPSADLIALNGQKIKIAGAWILSPAQFLLGGPGIDSVKDLKGKKVGINGSKGGSSSMLMTYALASAGLTFDDVQLNVLQDASSQMQAFAAGQIDAMVTFPPFVGRMIEQRAGTSIIREFEDLVFPSSQIIVNTQWAQEKPGQAQAAIRAMDKAVQRWFEEPEAVKKVIATALNLTAGDPMIDELYTFTTKSFEKNVVPIDVEMEKALFKMYREAGFPEATDKVASLVIAPELVEQALE